MAEVVFDPTALQQAIRSLTAKLSHQELRFVGQGLEAALEPGRTPASEEVFGALVQMMAEIADPSAKRKVLNALNVEALRRSLEPLPTQWTKNG